MGRGGEEKSRKTSERDSSNKKTSKQTVAELDFFQMLFCIRVVEV